MKFHLLICTILPLILAEELNYHRRRFTSNDDHLNSIGFEGSRPSIGGCRKKHPDNRSLHGGVEACASHKPLKVKGVEKMEKRLCADGYEYCSMAHKPLHHLPWNMESMPKSCYAFHYKKDKFAGYGHNCHRNLYFDGLLCCPSHPHAGKVKHNHLRVGTFHNRHHSKINSHNYVRK